MFSYARLDSSKLILLLKLPNNLVTRSHNLQLSLSQGIIVLDRYYPVTYTCTTTARIARVAITTNALRAQAGYTHIPTTPSSGVPRSVVCQW